MDKNENMTPDKNENTACCGCVGYGYVPVQMLYEVYSPADAIAAGTIFPELALTIEEYGKVCKATGGIK